MAPENRCSEYNKKDYSYPPNIEEKIVNQYGRSVDINGELSKPLPSFYKAELEFTNTTDTDIEHIVATSEAHDSGLCDVSKETRKRFARDLENMTLIIASPKVNRHEKATRTLPSGYQKLIKSGMLNLSSKSNSNMD